MALAPAGGVRHFESIAAQMRVKRSLLPVVHLGNSKRGEVMTKEALVLVATTLLMTGEAP